MSQPTEFNHPLHNTVAAAVQSGLEENSFITPGESFFVFEYDVADRTMFFIDEDYAPYAGCVPYGPVGIVEAGEFSEF